MNLDLKLKHYRISKNEFDKIKELLGREPQGVEWALFSALWSEHCSYKSSKIHLKKLFNKSPRLVSAEGENAGVIDIGFGEKIAFKMESHNHPSFIEPYQGAATGVGGILRDIFTMGARPVMLANYLCFGEPQAPRMKALVDGVVRGIGGYGNCVGVPTITGQVEFHRSYNKNILVNAFALGLFREGEKVFSAKATGVGNLVVYVGAKTGKDGVHGASMASESFDDKTEAKKPTIQKGDPFLEKLLIESCLEVMKNNLVESIQDMGAAGLTSSSFEMSARGGVGFNLHLDRVPLRDSTMGPEEILLSESQERMLLICKPKNLAKLQEVFKKWDLDAESIGEVVDGKEITLFWRGEILTQINPQLLVDHAPQYERPYDSWAPKNKVAEVSSLVSSPKETLLKVLSSPEGTSREWVYEQYDQRVGAKTAMDASQTLGVIRLPDSKRGLGLSLGCRPYIMRMDAQIGGADSVLYPSLELAAKGFQPLAVTDCLNFGSPENRTIMSEFVASLEAMSAACEALDAPIISGNVSFYNETLGQNITSTPATGVVGLRDNLNDIPKGTFSGAGDDIFI
jgi:phosphoribosylformylglycinamidine synthase subunit PurL